MLLVLPRELIVDILSRLAVKDFLRFKCVSKSCYALINDPSFVKKHLERCTDTKSEANLSLILMSKYGGNELYPLDFNDDDDVDDSHYSHHPSKSIGFNPGFLHQIVGSCNGLVCLVCLFDGMSSRFVIWNPYTRNSQKSPRIGIEFRGVFPLYLRFGYVCNYGYGFGHDRVSDDYKIIMILQVFRDDIMVGTESSVYSLKTNSWAKQSHDFPNNKRVELGFGTFASTGNALHWVIERNEVESNRCQHVIVAFDLGVDDNEYHEVQLPDYKFEMHSFNLNVLKGCLCICSSDRRSSSGSSDLWIMKEYGVKAPWTRLISIAHPYTDPFGNSIVFTPLVYSRRGDKVLLTSRNINHVCKLIWYDLTTKKVTILERPCLSNYRVKLVCLKSPAPVNGGGEVRNKRQRR